MNRTTFLFLALLIGSCIMTVNSRHAARTLITEKAGLQDKVTALKETIRRLELEKARIAARNPEGPKPGVEGQAGAASPKGVSAKAIPPKTH